METKMYTVKATIILAIEATNKKEAEKIFWEALEAGEHDKTRANIETYSLGANKREE